MVCIYCGSKTVTANSRTKARNNTTWRRRKCLECGAVVTTVEQIERALAITCKDNVGHLEPFSRDKLYISVHRSLKHRKDAIPAASGLTDTILAKLTARLQQASLDKQTITEVTGEVLRRFDKSAAVTYDAYHPLKM